MVHSPPEESGKSKVGPAKTGGISERRKELIPGFRPVQEALLSSRIRVLEVWIREEKQGPRVREIIEAAEKKSIRVSFKTGNEMNSLLPGVAHQGVAAVAGEYLYAEIEEVIEEAGSGEGEGLILAADHITDEGNLGALVRTGAFFGAHGLILPKDRSASISARIIKRSAGALLHLPVTRVVNLARTLVMMKEQGFWVIGTAGEGTDSIYDFDWKRNVVLVMGSEDKGLGPLIRAKCDQMVRIPGSGRVESLNISVAAGAILSEIQRRRGEDA